MKRILLTPGEPAGIGPEITLRFASEACSESLIAIADATLMQQRATQCKINVDIDIIENIGNCKPHQAGVLQVLHVPLAANSVAGQLLPDNSGYVLECLRVATELCMNKKAHAVVTGPVHKGIINDAGIAFTGHTEYLASISGGQPVMMLATDKLRVALATTHLPLKKVSDAISFDTLSETIQTLNNFLQIRCNIQQPKILVCGLNPHAGEDGHLGDEEITTISPVIEHCRHLGIDLSDPLPADTAFTSKYLENADAVLAMYHDQGLPVLKYSGFGRAVNITLGLPFIRTSVDHGTAIDLAGSGKASHSSLLAAVEMACSFS